MASDAIVVGGGPVGLWLAAELRLGGAAVTVLERRHEPDPHSKALTLHPRTLELLACRGVSEPFLAEGLRIPTGHFGGLQERMDFGVLDTPFPFTLALPQARTEELFEARARDLGADVRRGHQARGVDFHTDGVAVDVDGPDEPYRLDAAYVVGCDGTRSTIRTAAGIDFPGTDDTVWGWLADVVLDAPPAVGGLSLSGADGGMMLVPLPHGEYRIVGSDPSQLGGGRPGPLTLHELRATVSRIAGTDFEMRDPSWLSRFGNATRQAARYRAGRILLAGDAAHMHFPTGGVGLNVGVQDATNLGWRLADVLTGRAGDDRLDGYHLDRHPVGAELLESSRAQTALMTAYGTEGLALRDLLGRLIATVPDLSRELAERLSGLSVRYPAGDAAHPLTGTRAPNLALDGGDLFTALRSGRHLLLDFTGTTTPTAEDTDVHCAPRPVHRPAWAGVDTALIRPDGHVAAATSTRLAPQSP